jgi:hypothetical protein
MGSERGTEVEELAGVNPGGSRSSSSRALGMRPLLSCTVLEIRPLVERPRQVTGIGSRRVNAVGDGIPRVICAGIWKCFSANQNIRRQHVNRNRERTVLER